MSNPDQTKGAPAVGDERGGWGWPLAVSIGMAFMFFMIMRGCAGGLPSGPEMASNGEGDGANMTATATAPAPSEAIAPAQAAVEETQEVVLEVPEVDEESLAAASESSAGDDAFSARVGDFTLQGEAGGVEQRLIEFIESGRAPCKERDCWFTFDRLTFATGSASLDMTKSRAQLENIHQILAAHPGIQLKLGGYTDNTGSDAINFSLSERRAEAVATAVSGMGTDASRLATEGYGPEHPVASNDSAAGRAQNRRIDVRVLAR